MNKKEVLAKIDEALIDVGFQQPVILYDKKFRYPCSGDDAHSCKLLGFMLDIEYRTGTLIFVPDQNNVANDSDRNKG